MENSKDYIQHSLVWQNTYSKTCMHRQMLQSISPDLNISFLLLFLSQQKYPECKTLFDFVAKQIPAVYGLANSLCLHKGKFVLM